jgi:hypothetical protein
VHGAATWHSLPGFYTLIKQITNTGTLTDFDCRASVC